MSNVGRPSFIAPAHPAHRAPRTEGETYSLRLSISFVMNVSFGKKIGKIFCDPIITDPIIHASNPVLDLTSIQFLP
jgi:hypothetical protein